jgi:hypothetical protein
MHFLLQRTSERNSISSLDIVSDSVVSSDNILEVRLNILSLFRHCRYIRMLPNSHYVVSFLGTQETSLNSHFFFQLLFSWPYG